MLLGNLPDVPVLGEEEEEEKKKKDKKMVTPKQDRRQQGKTRDTKANKRHKGKTRHFKRHKNKIRDAKARQDYYLPLIKPASTSAISLPLLT